MRAVHGIRCAGSVNVVIDRTTSLCFTGEEKEPMI